MYILINTLIHFNPYTILIQLKAYIYTFNELHNL